VFDGLAPSLRGIAGVVNLEGPVAPSQPAGEGLKLFNAPGALSELHSLGVIAVGIANNHAHDTGEQGPTQTLRAVTDAGFHAAGGPAGPALLEVNGLKIAVSAHDLEHGVPRELSRELAEARVHADRLVATFHVTGPASYLPTKELRAAVEVALAAGADVVIAHGSHMLGPLERRGRAVIAWGLGNVVFACDCTDESDALLLELSFTSDRTLAWAVPIDAGLRGGPAQLSSDSKGTFDLLVGLGSKGLTLLPDGRVQF
jgi:poly-gamma-glutamate capsule biosynthesis protein CapA/YwtB (metallophosphatase superfamily)